MSSNNSSSGGGIGFKESVYGNEAITALDIRNSERYVSEART